MRVGIFFGGKSREREISFAGGRTVYDNLDKGLFEAIPIFIDSLGQFILLDWQYLYKGTIRDFYPSSDFVPKSKHQFQVYIESLAKLNVAQKTAIAKSVGTKIELQQLNEYIDFAFLALHGNLGEDGQIQGLLECLNIPYSGSGIRASSIGMDKFYQKKLMESAGFDMPKMLSIRRSDWMKGIAKNKIDDFVEFLGLPLVIRPANQGSSIGVSIIHQTKNIAAAINAAFFVENIQAECWNSKSEHDKIEYLRNLTDIRTGIGFPMQSPQFSEVIYHPDQLLDQIENYFNNGNKLLSLEGHQSEHTVVLEAFIEGREFSCVVIRGDEKQSIALPPTEIVKGNEVFDYRSKYLPGLSRKLTPIDIEVGKIEAIRKACETLYDFLGFNTYARIDGFIHAEGQIFLNDPNTTSGMLPSSFFFHQAAEIGLNPSQFLSYIIRTSLVERIEYSTEIGLYEGLLARLDTALEKRNAANSGKQKIAVLLGGYSSERHISVESGRNIYEKLASSDKYEPLPIFVDGNHAEHHLYQIPIHLLLKDNADDIRDKLINYHQHGIIKKIQKECRSIVQRFTGKNPVFKPAKISYSTLKEQIDSVFIALHGRPGEDGEVQSKLESLKIPYNGSDSSSAQITINKYQTLQKLKKEGMPTTQQLLVHKSDFLADKEKSIQIIENNIQYPLIAKPVDDGCSSAVKKIKNGSDLRAYLLALFRENSMVDEANRLQLGLQYKEEFPIKNAALIEALIDKKDAVHFLEITGGLLTKYNSEGKIEYEIFEPSEALSSGEVLSLEEKFLAGEGQNITPARYTVAEIEADYTHIAQQVKASLKKAAKTLNVTGYARIDAFVRVFKDGRADTIIIEVNALPGMTPATCIFHQCALNNYKPYDFIDHILEFGKKRNNLLLQSSKQ